MCNSAVLSPSDHRNFHNFKVASGKDTSSTSDGEVRIVQYEFLITSTCTTGSFNLTYSMLQEPWVADLT